MAKHPHRLGTPIPRNSAEADQLSHPKVESFNLAKLTADLAKQAGTHFSAKTASEGDVAWVGPCEEGGTRVVCYYDKNLDPSDCRNQPC